MAKKQKIDQGRPIPEMNYEYVSSLPLEEVMKDNFISYAVYTLRHRAIPDVRDGLKPINRRILYAMHLNKAYMSSGGRKKSAAMVGEVMGTYHPHGDKSIYDAACVMALDFKNNIPLLNPKGSLGSIDGDQPAAYRYTELKLERFSEEVLLSDLSDVIVDFDKNYDSTTHEPTVLPVRVPFGLINGIEGIATGWATSIPPHNLGEVIDGTVAYINNPKLTADELMKYIPAPDFPTGGVINGTGGLPLLYRTGSGRVKLRGRLRHWIDSNGCICVEIYEVPYSVKPDDIIKKCIDQKIDIGLSIKKITNGADKEKDVCINIVFNKKEDDINRITGILYTKAGLESVITSNMNMLCFPTPETFSVQRFTALGIIREFVRFRKEVLFKGNMEELRKNLDRIHILEGLLKVDMKMAVDMISNSEDIKEATEALIKAFKLTVVQADYILRIPLMRITRMEKRSTEAEIKKLTERNIILRLLTENNGDNKLIDDIIKEQSLAIKSKYTKPRKTEIIQEAEKVDIKRLIKNIPCMIVYTKNGYIKRLALDQNSMVQSRGGQGRNVPGLDLDDEVIDIIDCLHSTELTLMTNTGRVYTKMAVEIDETNGVGRKIENLFNLNTKEKPVLFTSFDNNIVKVALVLDNGDVKLSSIHDLKGGSDGKVTKIKRGDKLINIKGNEKLVAAVGLTASEKDKDIIIASKNGKAIRIDTTQIRVSSRNAGAIKGMSLEGNDMVTSACGCTSDNIVIATNDGYAKQTPISEFRVAGRGGRGTKISKGSAEVLYVGSKSSGLLTLTTNKNKMLTFDLTKLSSSSKTSRGVKIASLDEDGYITNIN